MVLPLSSAETRPSWLASKRYDSSQLNNADPFFKNHLLVLVWQEIGPPDVDSPCAGYVVTNVTLPPLCSPRIKSGPPGETAQAATQFAAELVAGGGVVDLGSLCIAPSKWVWVLHVDLVCLNWDGGLLDACSVALVAALKSLTLPSVTYDEELDKLTCNPNERTALSNVKQPVTSTFAIFEKYLLQNQGSRPIF